MVFASDVCIRSGLLVKVERYVRGVDPDGGVAVTAKQYVHIAKDTRVLFSGGVLLET